MMPQGSLKKYLLPLQALVSAFLVGALLWYMPEGSLKGLTQASALWVGVAVCAFWAGQAVSGQRLYWLVLPLLQHLRPNFSPLLMLRATLLGTFAGTFLPLNVGGDAVKIGWLLARLGKGCMSVLLAGMLVERMLSVVVTVVFCLIMALLCSLSLEVPLPDAPALWIGGVLLVCALVLGWLCRSTSAQAQWLRHSLADAGNALRWWKRNPAQLGVCMGMSLANLLCGAAQIAALALAVGQALTLSQALAAIALTMVLTYLPISISGLGVMEAGLAGLLAGLGYPPTLAVQVGILLRVSILLGVMPGAFFWRSAGRTTPPPPGTPKSDTRNAR